MLQLVWYRVTPFPSISFTFYKWYSWNIDFNALTDSDSQLLPKNLILFADDIVVFATSPESLQAQIDCLYKYSCKWSFEMYIDRTKICVQTSERMFAESWKWISFSVMLSKISLAIWNGPIVMHLKITVKN